MMKTNPTMRPIWQTPTPQQPTVAVTTGLLAGAALANIGPRGLTSAYLDYANNLTQIGWYSVKDYGATGNGSTNDYTAIVNTVAASTGTAGIYFPPGTYLINTSITFSVPVTLAPGAILSPAAAVVLTFNAPINASPQKIFQNSGTAVIDGHTPIIFAEWFGAKGDGVTDDSTAINAALKAGVGPNTGGGGGGLGVSPIVQLLAKTYYTTSTITITRSGVTLAGAGSGVTYLLPSTNTFDAIQITGTSGAGILQYNELRDFAIQSANSLGQTGAAIRVTYTNFTKVRDVRLSFVGIGVYLSATQGFYGDQIEVQTATVSAANIYGFYIDGSIYNNSTYLNGCDVNGSGASPSGFSFGFYLAGLHINDFFAHYCEADVYQYGFFVDGSSATPFNNAFDVHFAQCIADECLINAFYVQNIIAGGAVEIAGGYANVNNTLVSATACINVVASYGVSVQDMQCAIGIGGSTTVTGIWLQNSNNCKAARNSAHCFQTGILLTNTTRSIVVDNDVYNLTGVSSPGDGIQLTSGSVRNTISNNSIGGNVAGAWTTGIAVASGCDYCNIIGNIMDPAACTTTISNNAANTHSVVLGVTN